MQGSVWLISHFLNKYSAKVEFYTAIFFVHFKHTPFQLYRLLFCVWRWKSRFHLFIMSAFLNSPHSLCFSPSFSLNFYTEISSNPSCLCSFVPFPWPDSSSDRYSLEQHSRSFKKGVLGNIKLQLNLGVILPLNKWLFLTHLWDLLYPPPNGYLPARKDLM